MGEEIERETFECDVCFVGAGPACLAGAIQLHKQFEMHNEAHFDDPDFQPIEPRIIVIEKGSEVGSHGVSGAVLDPKALQELVPDWKERPDFPVERWVEKEQMLVLTENAGFSLPAMPPELHDMGKPIISIAKFQKWLAENCESRGIEVLTATAGWSLLYNEDKTQVVGVRCRDHGIDAHNQPTEEYEPGADIRAKMTVIGEGPRGHLARELINHFDLTKGLNQMTYEMGCKEVLQLPKGSVEKGFVTLLAGYPLSGSLGPINGTFGGAFIYSMANDQVCIGLLAVLDAKNPSQDVQYLLQKLKLHPKVKEILKGGRVIKYGAKAVTVGGWGCMPKLYAPGAMLVGDTASFLNAVRIKGIHLAMKSGMLAGDTAFEALLKSDFSDSMMQGYKRRVDASWVREEMQTSQNFHTDISNSGLIAGSIRYGMAKYLGAGSIRKAHEDHTAIQKKSAFEAPPKMVSPGRYEDLMPHYKGADEDDCYIIDKLTAVYLSGSIHDEHQPCHLRVEPESMGFAPDHCVTRCTEEYGNPCERFCPAQVYNMVEKEGERKLQVDFSNCVHCKTCDIRDPYQIIKWVPPNAGEGPEYHMM